MTHGLVEPLTVADYLLSIAIVAIGLGGALCLLWLVAGFLADILSHYTQ